MRSLIYESGAAYELHVLDVPDTICKQRLRKRNAGGKHPFQVSEEEYDLISSYFVPPEPSEGFNVIVHTVAPAVDIDAPARPRRNGASPRGERLKRDRKQP